ncbi:MAG: hypothetical protein V8Q79_00795 [Christensenellales bacterium]
MKRGLAALLLLMGVGMMSANAAAQTTMNVFFTRQPWNADKAACSWN